ncbi:hypothetical protein [Streptomyces sp. NPDC048644]|uniref:hypothetical protein n=1 Tax=Streptomyces sp. NPDC048644 TaxID=3365582 RepID=UPI00371B0541
MSDVYRVSYPNLFLANNATSWFIYEWKDAGAQPSHWARPSVGHTPFSSRQAQLRVVEERYFWDWDAARPPAWGLLLQSLGDSQFAFTITLVTN